MVRAKTMFVVVSVCVLFLLVFFSRGLIFSGGFSRNKMKYAREAKISVWQLRDNFSKVNLGLTPSTQCYIIRKSTQCVCAQG